MIGRLILIGAVLLGGAIAGLHVIESQYKMVAADTEEAEVAPREDGCYTEGGQPR